MSDDKFESVTIIKKANIYFDGKGHQPNSPVRGRDSQDAWLYAAR